MAGSPQHVTLSAGIVSTLTFDANYGRVEILNVDGAAAIYFRTDGTDPVVAATGSHVLPAMISSVEVADQTSGQATVVKLISSGTPKVSVRGI